jgi:hypothetical protein
MPRWPAWRRTSTQAANLWYGKSPHNAMPPRPISNLKMLPPCMPASTSSSLLTQLAEIIHRIDRLAGVIVQRSASPESVNFFRIDAGRISGPVTFAIQSAEHTKSQSMESRVQEALASFLATTPSTALETMEHLALLKRWYYRSRRIGEIFLVDEKGALPMRRVVRGISRVYRGEKSEDNASRVADSSSVPGREVNSGPES